MTETAPGQSLLPEPAVLDARKTEASAWFRSLRDRICAAFETLEDEATGPFDPLAATRAGRFERKTWSRTDHSGAPGGGGEMSDHARPRVREGGRPHLHRPRRVRP